MTGDVVQVFQQEGPDAGVPGSGTSPEEPVDVECPVCYQEYNHYNKCPRMLSPPAIPCPLCRCLTPLEAGDDALSLPCNSRILARLPHVAFCLPGTVATFTQRVVLSLEADNRDAHFIILPTVSLRVQQMYPSRVSGLVSEDEAIQQSTRKLFYVQLLAVTFWVLFVITCVVGVVFGPHFFRKKF
ncbi:uncharacterized protein isoform X2 [Takifugu rubripes]|uniref:uncharacterized protein isoform X2 n=1 Tax=Takifugu rubripes TaxID=31033 RepID=UPI001145529C|nr:uncharacterized protein LOC115250735 isoform X2 [Takifugu rubripes]